jgi:hypothetical protein
MHKAAAWTASNLRHSPFEWSASLPRIFLIQNLHVWQNVARHKRDGGFPLEYVSSIPHMTSMWHHTRIGKRSVLVWLYEKVSYDRK